MATGNVFANYFTPDFVIQGWTSVRHLMNMYHLIFLIDWFLICIHIDETNCIDDYVKVYKTTGERLVYMLKQVMNISMNMIAQKFVEIVLRVNLHIVLR